MLRKATIQEVVNQDNDLSEPSRNDWWDIVLRKEDCLAAKPRIKTCLLFADETWALAAAFDDCSVIDPTIPEECRREIAPICT